MAKITRIELVDDLDGKKADRSITFAFDGTAYAIDLSDKNAAALEKALAPFIDAATVTSGSRKKKAAKRNRDTGNGKVREWARAAGYQLRDRGRIPEDVRAAYDAAHTG